MTRQCILKLFGTTKSANGKLSRFRISFIASYKHVQLLQLCTARSAKQARFRPFRDNENQRKFRLVCYPKCWIAYRALTKIGLPANVDGPCSSQVEYERRAKSLKRSL